MIAVKVVYKHARYDLWRNLCIFMPGKYDPTLGVYCDMYFSWDKYNNPPFFTYFLLWDLQATPIV